MLMITCWYILRLTGTCVLPSRVLTTYATTFKSIAVDKHRFLTTFYIRLLKVDPLHVLLFPDFSLYRELHELLLGRVYLFNDSLQLKQSALQQRLSVSIIWWAIDGRDTNASLKELCRPFKTKPGILNLLRARSLVESTQHIPTSLHSFISDIT